MSDYQAGKDLAMLEQALREMQTLVEQLYNIVEHNVRNKILKEPPKK